MKLGDQAIGVRSTSGSPTKDDLGDDNTPTVDRKVRWCAVYPSARISGRTPPGAEPEDRSGPAATTMTVLAPPSAAIGMFDVVIWPITSETTDDNGQLHLDGRLWQVVGEPNTWPDSLEVRLHAST